MRFVVLYQKLFFRCLSTDLHSLKCLNKYNVFFLWALFWSLIPQSFRTILPWQYKFLLYHQLYTLIMLYVLYYININTLIFFFLDDDYLQNASSILDKLKTYYRHGGESSSLPKLLQDYTQVLHITRISPCSISLSIAYSYINMLNVWIIRLITRTYWFN